jgi:hypothetical protein
VPCKHPAWHCVLQCVCCTRSVLARVRHTCMHAHLLRLGRALLLVAGRQAGFPGHRSSHTVQLSPAYTPFCFCCFHQSLQCQICLHLALFTSAIGTSMLCRQSGAEAQRVTKACLGPSCRQLQAVVTSLGWLVDPPSSTVLAGALLLRAGLHIPLCCSNLFTVVPSLPCICWSFVSIHCSCSTHCTAVVATLQRFGIWLCL